MKITNLKTCAELRSENPIEARVLIKASMRSYSPRTSGLMPNEDQMLVITLDEAEEFSNGVLRDVEIESRDKWAISRLIACWLSGEIKDEGATFI